MSIDLITEKFFKRKLEYVHNNPCQPHWNLAQHPTEYRYSTASYYDGLGDEFGLVIHMEELRCINSCGLVLGFTFVLVIFKNEKDFNFNNNDPFLSQFTWAVPRFCYG